MWCFNTTLSMGRNEPPCELLQPAVVRYEQVHKQSWSLTTRNGQGSLKSEEPGTLPIPKKKKCLVPRPVDSPHPAPFAAALPPRHASRTQSRFLSIQLAGRPVTQATHGDTGRTEPRRAQSSPNTQDGKPRRALGFPDLTDKHLDSTRHGGAL